MSNNDTPDTSVDTPAQTPAETGNDTPAEFTPTEVSDTPDTADAAASPTAYDLHQDEQLAAKDAEIAQLRAQLDAAITSNAGGETTAPDPAETGEAVFHEVLPPSTPDNSVPAAGATLGDVPIGESPTVNLDPTPDTSPVPHRDVESVRNTEELRDAVAEILEKTREIHSTLEWVKGEAPKIAAALADSPFSKLLPTFMTGGL